MLRSWHAGRALCPLDPLRSPGDWYHYPPHRTDETQKLREVKPLAQGHTACEQESRGWNPQLNTLITGLGAPFAVED